jgi:Cu(I)/Ag(I) efflux system protein CusF
MKLILAAVLALAVAPAAVARSSSDAPTSGMSAAADSSMVEAAGSGVVTAVDPKAGTVTIHHGPIAKLSWPAMTMAFKADPPSLLQGVRTGQSVNFTLMQMDGQTTVTAIQPK